VAERPVAAAVGAALANRRGITPAPAAPQAEGEAMTAEVDDDYPFEVCPVCGVPVEDHGDDWCPAEGA